MTSKAPCFLLLGGTGQVGRALSKALVPLAEKKGIQIVKPSRQTLDLEKTKTVRNFLEEKRPVCILNAAAYTRVDDAQDNLEIAHVLNAELPHVLAAYCATKRLPLVHYSTDYVFDGAKQEPYHERDDVNPLNVYGTTKLAGEKAIQDAAAPGWIFRTSWVYSPRGHNFVQTIKRLVQIRKKLSVVSDQRGAPTSADVIAKTTAAVLTRWFDNAGDCPQGLYHLTTTGHTTWHAWAQEITAAVAEREDIQCMPANILPVTTENYLSAKSKRPLNSCLSTAKLRKDFHITLPAWQDEFHRLLPGFLTPSDQKVQHA